MALQFFLTYIGVFFAGTIALLAVVKQLVGPFAGSRKPLIWGGIGSLLTSLVAFGVTFVTDNLFIVFWILGALFVIYGIISLVLTHRKFFKPGEDNEKSKFFSGELLYSLSLLFFVVVVFSSLQYFLKDKSFQFYPLLLSALLFFIPLLLVQTFHAAYSIPKAYFDTWHYPLHQRIELPDENTNEKIVVMGFEIAKKASDTKDTYFRAKAPEDITLGALFYHFINDYNEMQSETPIEYVSGPDQSYEWWFRLKRKWYQPEVILKPEDTIRENGIVENAIIICERIPPAADGAVPAKSPALATNR